jgi:hypothetical protein
MIDGADGKIADGNGGCRTLLANAGANSRPIIRYAMYQAPCFPLCHFSDGQKGAGRSAQRGEQPK